MKIKTAEFAHCVGKREQLPCHQLPEIAFAGRSNVGKSTLINRLVNRKALARTSSQPGKTQTINFYLVNNQLYLVDLPGYGYAKVSHIQREQWRRLLEDYLANRSQLGGVVLVVDSRHPGLAADKQMYEWLCHYRRPIVVVATKVDKLRQRESKANLDKLGRDFPGAVVLPFSGHKGTGREPVWQAINQLINISEVD